MTDKGRRKGVILKSDIPVKTNTGCATVLSATVAALAASYFNPPSIQKKADSQIYAKEDHGE
ncbi:MAG: hypothetical protein WC831_04985 [Parcubacteria group bacterium]|jgi:hypothetical protein